ncbi:MAG TPA: hypothetical protein VFM38_14320 [Candidatus Limnocylindrales bacterium]|nr:hypothetical protein [Candidatus Limnocylindrales bacterium]
MGDRSVDAQLAALAEATVELDTVWREIVRPGRLAERSDELERRHDAALRRLLDVDDDLRRATGLDVAGDGPL